MASAAAVVAIIAEAERKIQRRFFAADAVRADRAVAFTPSGSIEVRQFRKMLERGIIKRDGADRYWIDAIAYDIEIQRQRRQTIIALVILSVLFVVALAVIVGSGHNVTR